MHDFKSSFLPCLSSSLKYDGFSLPIALGCENPKGILFDVGLGVILVLQN
jgi:hypothetical protein